MHFCTNITTVLQKQAALTHQKHRNWVRLMHLDPHPHTSRRYLDHEVSGKEDCTNNTQFFFMWIYIKMKRITRQIKKASCCVTVFLG